MFKRFWQHINEWADALSMDDPRGDFSLQERVAKLERDLEGLQIQSRTAPVRSPDDRVHRRQS